MLRKGNPEMASMKIGLVAAALMLVCPAAFAADIPMQPVPVAPVPFGGWYLRGDIGFSNQDVDDLDNANYHLPGVLGFRFPSKGFDSGGFGGIGIGYQFNQWFRTDITGEYRGKTTFSGTDLIDFGGGFFDTNTMTASKSEWTTLLNAYVDLGDWYGFSPFIGGGVGFSRNTISGFTDLNVPNGGVAFASDNSEWNFAWALQAGLAYHITPAMTVELAYRYLDLGDAQSGDIVAYNGFCPPGGCINNPEKFNDITSQDVKLGLRWRLGPS
jgi:opacity protein-like surface antigen